MTRLIIDFSAYTFLLVTTLAGTAARGDQEFDLFPNRSFDEWEMYDGSPAPGGWEWTEQGELHLKDRRGLKGSLLSKRDFGDFDLSFEWRISKRGNSGIKYRVTRFKNKWWGIEYQLQDDLSRNFAPNSKGNTAAIYGMVAPAADKSLKPVGQFNLSRIRVENNVIRHWLNGVLVTQAEIGSDDWNERYAVSKFAELKDWGKARAGRLMITDHSRDVWYRNFQLKLLSAPTETGK